MNTLRACLKEKENHVVSLTKELDQARVEIANLMIRLQFLEGGQTRAENDELARLRNDMQKIREERDAMAKKSDDLENTVSVQKEEIDNLRFEMQEREILEEAIKEEKAIGDGEDKVKNFLNKEEF